MKCMLRWAPLALALLSPVLDPDTIVLLTVAYEAAVLARGEDDAPEEPRSE